MGEPRAFSVRALGGWVTAAMLVFFVVWAVWLMLTVSAARRDLEARVGWLVAIQPLQVALGEELDSPERRSSLALELRELAAGAGRMAHLEPDVTTAARSILEAADELESSPDGAGACRLALDGLVTALRASTRTLSAELGRRWRDINILAFIALLLAGSALVGLALARRQSRRLLRLHEQLLAELSERRRVESALRESKRTTNEFVAVVSHELRTPVSAILGAVELLRNGTNGGNRGNLLDLASRNARRLGTLLNDLIDIARIEAGELRIQPAVVDLAAVLREALDLHSELGLARQVRFELSTPPTPALAIVDAQRVIQVLSNLMSNAVKHSPPGALVTIALRTEGGAWRVSVGDQGPGVLPEHRERIFKKFVQADSSTSRTVDGSGLGLPIARAIVEAHGGVLALECGEPEATVFSFTIPVAPATTAP